MFKIDIVIIPGYEPDHLIEWANMFGCSYNLTTDKYCSDFVITSDLYPKPNVLRSIVRKEPFATEYKRKYEKGIWHSSFCFYMPGKSYSPIEELYASNPPFLDACMSPPTVKQSRREILWNLISREWYTGGVDVCERILYPLYIQECHHIHLRGEKVNISELRERIVFYPSLPMIDMEGTISLQHYENIIRDDFITLNDCLVGLTRKRYNLSISEVEFLNHPLSFSGLHIGIPTLENPKVDMTKTIVTLYYDLNLANRSEEVYLSSLRQIARLRYPIVIFGNQDTIDTFRKFRGNLNTYTEYVSKDLLDWDIYSRYYQENEKETIREKSLNYKLLTNLKFYAIREAIRLNPFASESYVWMDAGIYKNDDFPTHEMYPFRNIRLVENRITVQSLWQAGGTTNDEYTNAVSSIVCMIFIGHNTTWKKYLPILDSFLRSKFDDGNIQTEQNVWGRVDALYPGYLYREVCTYSKQSLSHFLHLE